MGTETCRINVVLLASLRQLKSASTGPALVEHMQRYCTEAKTYHASPRHTGQAASTARPAMTGGVHA
ncbi:hypothetical protein [Metallibacterium scheffleri]|jgi:hypothetical protein|uniref:hypothetical protein n=1 Tax=Metallibacterium scheffleri TaxID=993689 RepID=UPI0010A03086|nr:hypothetical protein [Metallibacterium scheffleri]